MEIEISKVGERGQVVIPQDFRNELHMKKGDKLLVVRSKDKIIFQQMARLKSKTLEQLKEDLVDIKIAEDAFKEIDKGNCISQSKEDFLKDMEKWVKE